MACAAARSPADQDRLLKILQLQRFKMCAQQLDLMHFLRKTKCTPENGIVMLSTGAESGFNSNRKMAASVLYNSHHEEGGCRYQPFSSPEKLLHPFSG
ncbi:signal recognition particle 19 kDa protein isoform X7 [Myotis daubentonii]|uniref:signal recognition particle 19 kDa protein isoform X7 n=1 Tax=Myotis daubentonii TaxID=98922 RepID=UPI002872DDE1|nr:signal recognition particle 19 kDa protein isoform X7 [Myotis daubentonii]